ncbi:MAG: hypothetical protein QG597_1898 [Actinomycetota bacterium]|nr:hypothetical protein [Actinomycetota bacterium]
MFDATTAPPEPDDMYFDGDPIPLTATRALPTYPVDALPPPVAAMVEAVAHCTQTDPAMAGTSALTVLSACTGGHALIEVRPGWREPLHIYAATVAAPGERKSAVQSAMAGPLLSAEKKLVEDILGERLEAQARKHVAEVAAEKAKQAAAKAANGDNWDEAMADAIGAVSIAEKITVPPIPRIVADDVTPEAAASLMAEQGGRLAIISAEGGIFDIIAGRYNGNVANLDCFLKGHAGDPMKVDRKGRSPEYIEQPALTLGLMIQPDVLSTIGANRQFRGRGLLARFLYAFPTSKVGRRLIAAPAAGDDTVGAYADVITSLAAGMAGWVGDPAVLTLTPAAHEAMIRIETDVEKDLDGDGPLRPLADWGSKFCGAVARIAGMLHLAQHGAELGPRTAVTADTVVAAFRIGNYYRAAAIKAFSDMGADQGTADALYLLHRIASIGVDELSARDMFNAARGRFKSVQDMAPAVDKLIDHGLIAPIPQELPTGRGRPPSPRFKVHHLAAENA